jgi:hypothetical protein
MQTYTISNIRSMLTVLVSAMSNTSVIQRLDDTICCNGDSYHSIAVYVQLRKGPKLKKEALNQEPH